MLFLMVALFAIAYIVFGMRNEANPQNPEGNCLSGEKDCGDRSKAPGAQDTKFYLERAGKGQDRLLNDGRLDLTTYPTPDPQASYRDLF